MATYPILCVALGKLDGPRAAPEGGAGKSPLSILNPEKKNWDCSHRLELTSQLMIIVTSADLRVGDKSNLKLLLMAFC